MTISTLKDDIIEKLKNIKDPELERDIISLGFIDQIDIQNTKAFLHFRPCTLNCPFLDEFIIEIKNTILQIDGIEDVDIILTPVDENNFPDLGNLSPGGIDHLNNVKKVVAVMSGKGGVGKSLVTGLLAVYLNRAGYRVGVLDADITGPSIPKMFFTERPAINYTPRALLPAETLTQIKIMSINLILPKEEDAVVWRGPLIGRTIHQFWTDTLWGNLDYLIVDLPPGTSDAPLTVLQSLPISGVLLVTSPQDLAGMVVRKAADMAQKIDIPILGLVENMSYFKAPDTSKEYEIYGPSHAKDTAKTLNVPVLARLPIDAALAINCDQGKVEECQLPEFDAVSDWIKSNTPVCAPPKMPIPTAGR